MKRIAILIVFTLAVAVIAATASQPVGFEKNWHHWRGPHATGVAADANRPRHGVKLKTSVGNLLSPVRGMPRQLFGKTKFSSKPQLRAKRPKQKPKNQADDNPFSGFFNQRRGRGAVENAYRFDLIAINREDGSILWQKNTARAKSP